MTNDDPQAVQNNLQKNNFSFYKGAMVFSAALPIDRSALSYVVIVMDDYYLSRPVSEFTKTLNHEYGHFEHMKQIGIAAYTTTTAIPSLISAGIADDQKTGFPKWLYDNYFNLPWERIADQLGGVNGTYLPGATKVASIYWVYTLIDSLG